MNAQATKKTLTNNDIQSLKGALEDHRREILKNAKVIKVDFEVATDDRLDEVDLALNDVEQGMQMRLGNRENLYFKKVEEALLRIKDGTYGLCLDCGKSIGLKRLEARPTAELCIECKEAAERLENLSAEGRKPKSLGRTVNFKA